MIGLLILALLVLTQIVIGCILVVNSMKYVKKLQTTCKNFSVLCKNESNFELCKWAAQLSKDAVKFDENTEPKYKDSCCGNPPDNKYWMQLNNTTVEDETENGFTKNCMNSINS